MKFLLKGRNWRSWLSRQNKFKTSNVITISTTRISNLDTPQKQKCDIGYTVYVDIIEADKSCMSVSWAVRDCRSISMDAVNKCGDNRWRGLTTKDPTTQLLKAAPPRSQNEPIIQLFSVDWRRVEPLSAEWLRDWNGSDIRFSLLDTQASEEHPAPHHWYKDKRLVLIRQSCVTYSWDDGRGNESDWTALIQRQYLMNYLMICGGNSQTCERRTEGS